MGFVGRAGAVSAVTEAVEGSARGSAGLVVVEGEPGIGKSALIRHVIERWVRADPARRTLQVKADELASGVPFGPLADQLRRHGAGPAPAALADPVEDPALRFARARHELASFLLDAVEALVADRPLAVVIDDAQWLDQATAGLLERLLHELHDRPLAVLLALRPLPRRRFVAALLARGGDRPHDRHVALAPQPVAELEAVLAAHGLAGAVTATQLTRVGGNPLYAIEVARAAGGAGDPARSDVAPSLRSTILRRLGFLGDEARAALRTASLLGSAFSLVDLVGVSALPYDAVLRALDEAVGAGVLRASDDGFEFSHDVVREALYEDVPPAVRRTEHRRIAHVLAAAGAPATTVATHASIGAEPHDVEAIGWLERAALEASMRSLDDAVSFLRRALDLRPPPEQRGALQDLLASQLARSGRFDEVVDMAEQERVVAGVLSVGVTVALAQALVSTHHAADAVAVLEATPTSTTHDRARILGMLATCRLTAGDGSGAAVAAASALEAARDAGALEWVVQMLATQAWLAVAAGRPVEAADLAGAAVRAAEDTSPFVGVFCRLAHGIAKLEGDALEEAAVELAATAALADATGAAANVTLAHAGAALAAYGQADLDGAAVQAQIALDISHRRGNRTSDLYALGLLARVALHRGDLAAAAEHVAEGERRLAEHGPALGAELVVWARVALEAATDGRPSDEAVDLLGFAWAVHPYRYLLTWRLVAPDLVRWLLASGRGDLAASVAADVGSVEGPGRVVEGAVIVARWCRALVTGDAHSLLAVATAARAGRRPLEAAGALRDSGLALLDADDRSRGAQLLAEGLNTFSAHGALLDARQCAHAARRRRARLVLPAPSRPSRASGLTAAEEEVASLAAAGRTNREIAERLAMSRFTVDTHLRCIYRKLGIRSRVDLAATWRR